MLSHSSLRARRKQMSRTAASSQCALIALISTSTWAKWIAR